LQFLFSLYVRDHASQPQKVIRKCIRYLYASIPVCYCILYDK
jgi:hypothetical protein